VLGVILGRHGCGLFECASLVVSLFGTPRLRAAPLLTPDKSLAHDP
jgi:hypothetical protein